MAVDSSPVRIVWLVPKSSDKATNPNPISQIRARRRWELQKRVVSFRRRGREWRGVAVKALSSVCNSFAFLQNTCKRDEPQMQPDVDRVMLARTAGMAAREEQFWALLV
jgi:hypothetical protein